MFAIEYNGSAQWGDQVKVLDQTTTNFHRELPAMTSDPNSPTIVYSALNPIEAALTAAARRDEFAQRFDILGKRTRINDAFR